MTDDASLPAAVERALDAHEAFVPTADREYELTTTVFETAVTADGADGPRDGRFHVTVRVPTLGAAVDGETVADVVEDGWFETFERRLADAYGVAERDAEAEPAVERRDRQVAVRFEYDAWDAAEGVADAKTLIEYVEGTYAQGVVPGYEYGGPARELLENARTRGQRAAEDGSGGAPL